MSDDVENQEEKRTIVYKDVDANDPDSGWDPSLFFKSQFKYRVYFENDIGLKNGLHLTILRDWLEEKGEEGKDWILVMSDFPMENLWNRSQDDEERRMRGNHVYLTSMDWLVMDKLLDNDTDIKLTTQRITLIETRIA